jgi:hypothetical protein
MIGSPEQNGIMEHFFGSMTDEESGPPSTTLEPKRSRRSTPGSNDCRTQRPH